MNTEQVKFVNKEGYELSAKIDWPISPGSHPFAIFAHVFTGSKNNKSARHISRSLTHFGIAVLRFDFTGLGDSEGDFSETNFTSNVDDLICAARYLEERYNAPSIMIGHSFGGAAAIFAGAKLDAIKAIVTIGAPSYPEHVTHLLKDDIEVIKAKGSATVEIGGRQFEIKKQFLDDLQNQDHMSIISNLRKALLVMHSPQDRVVEIDNAAHIYTLARHPKSFITLDGADHLLTAKEDAYYVGQVIASWARRYVEFPEREKLMTDQQVVVKLSDEDQFTTDIQMGSHAIIADEPEDFGGNDFGPDPYKLLNASLGACTAMTLQLYARRKGWKLDDVRIHLSHAKKTFYHDDMTKLDVKQSKVDRFERVIELTGDLSEEQRNRLLNIAKRCPVHRTLSTPNVFATRLKEDADWIIENSGLE